MHMIAAYASLLCDNSIALLRDALRSAAQLSESFLVSASGC
jgi:hypothetical protein